MSFFDQKEEVIDLGLTPHGRYLLSIGKLKPTYYAFFDDDILYDSNYTAIGFASGTFHSGTIEKFVNEDQNNIEDRIEKTTPRPHAQYTFRERTPNLVQYDTYEDTSYIQNTHEREYGLTAPLGTSDVHTNFAPAWDVKFHKGQISSSFSHYTGSGPTYPMPQLNCEDIQYDLLLGNDVPGVAGLDLSFPEEERMIISYDDSSFVEMREGFLLIELNEANVPYEKENFEIECFEVIEEEDTAGNVTETLKPMRFGFFGKPTETDEVAYYMDISIDSRIRNSRLCRYKGVDNTENTFLPPIFRCGGEASTVLPPDPYETLVSESDVGDVCLEDC